MFCTKLHDFFFFPLFFFFFLAFPKLYFEKMCLIQEGYIMYDDLKLVSVTFLLKLFLALLPVAKLCLIFN